MDRRTCWDGGGTTRIAGTAGMSGCASAPRTSLQRPPTGITRHGGRRYHPVGVELEAATSKSPPPSSERQLRRSRSACSGCSASQRARRKDDQPPLPRVRQPRSPAATTRGASSEGGLIPTRDRWSRRVLSRGSGGDQRNRPLYPRWLFPVVFLLAGFPAFPF
jgi:hypothetical protein